MSGEVGRWTEEVTSTDYSWDKARVPPPVDRLQRPMIETGKMRQIRPPKNNHHKSAKPGFDMEDMDQENAGTRVLIRNRGQCQIYLTPGGPSPSRAMTIIASRVTCKDLE